MRPKKKSRRKTAFAISCVCILAVSALILYNFMGAPAQPVKSAAVTRADATTGHVLVPDGTGACNKYAIGNESGKGSYEGTAPCNYEPPKEGRGSLPPALRGMQDNLRR